MLTATMNKQNCLPPTLQGYTWRAPSRQDMPALYEMLLAVDCADDRGFTMALEDVQTQFDDPWCNPETDFRLALTESGQIAAMARVFVNPQPHEECRAHLWDEIHPEHRGRGLEECTLEWMQDRGKERLLEKDTALPRGMRIGIQADLYDRIAQIEQHGFRPIRHFYRMRRDLSQPIPAAALAEGLTLRPYAPELDRAMLETFNEAFHDHWGFEPTTYEEWQMFLTESPNFRPALTFAAMDGDQVVGLSLNTINPEANQRHGVNEGWIAELGVRRPWRKRGVATALLCHSMQAFKAAGLDHATLGVDTESLTGALRLYERLGFVAIKRFTTFAKPVEQP